MFLKNIAVLLDMGIYLAISYDTEMTIDDRLPGSVISADAFDALSLEAKKEAWVNFLGSGDIWSDPDHVRRSRNELDTLKRLGGVFKEHGGRATSFVLGKWLDYAVSELGSDFVRDSFDLEVFEIGSHSYDHRALIATGDKTRDGIAPTLQLNEVRGQLVRSAGSILRHLGVRVTGLRVPMGNLRPFEEGERGILEALEAEGYKYVSSWLKTGKTVPNGVADAQPFFYKSLGFPGLLEIPGVGFYDVHGAQPTRLLMFDDEGSWSIDERLGVYKGVIDEAQRFESETGRDVFVPLVYHPGDVTNYDSKLEFHRRFLGDCKERGVNIVSYDQIDEMMRSPDL